ncbi:unnamed protein product [Allacma fusca]|uniref:Uncharacterized protein n=1 Tax=Allacma fusca TaxID=39272 RepID=A0A8J2NZ80_9HEXA|nr:unnamed protein product [Allacma fusca]
MAKMYVKPGSDKELEKMSTRLVQVQEEFHKGLAQIASMCGHLIGLELTAEDVKSGKVVINTLEQMRSEIDTLKTQFRKFEPGAIIANTTAEEETWLREQTEDIRLKPFALADGASMKGQNITDISANIPTNADCKATTTIQIINYMDESLTCPLFDFARGTSFGDIPKVIVGCTSEVVCFQGDSKFSSGLCSYRIGTSDLRLTVKFAAGLNGKILLGLAFTPQNVPVNGKLYSFNSGRPPRPDLKFMYDHELTSGPLDSLVQHRNLLAKAAMYGGPKAVVEVSVMEISFQRTFEDAITKSMEIMRNQGGKNFKESVVYDEVIPPGIKDKLSCVIEITNLLNVPLEKPTRYIQNCLHHNLIPSTVLPFTREIFYASDNGDSKTCTNTIRVLGIFTYDIQSTDLQLAVVFQNLDREGNSYAIAFNTMSEVLETTKEMMGTLLDWREWKTRPDRRFLEAGHEEASIQVRNAIATASMTTDTKSVLRILIYSL